MAQHSWNDIAPLEVTPGITRQLIHTASLTLARICFQKGAGLALHHHVHEQVTTVISGRLRLEVNGELIELGPGSVGCIASDVPHSVEALEDTLVLDVFTPARTDWQ